MFRHDAGRTAGPPAWAYALLFAVALAVGYGTMATFGTATVWLANGVVVAALLQLHRRQALMVLAACLVIELVANSLRGSTVLALGVNAFLDIGMSFGAAILARRVSGAALDLRRPGRLVRFALLAVVPAAVTSALIGMGMLALVEPQPWRPWAFHLQNYVVMEVLDLLLVTPALLLLARRHRFRDTAPTAKREAGLVLALMLAVTGAVFWQNDAPLLFLVLPPMVLISLRLSPTWTAGSLIAMAVISGAATLMGHGPIHLVRLAPAPGLESIPPLVRQLGVYNLFLLATVVTVLPISTVMTERRRLVARLRARTVAAQEARRTAEHADAAKARFLAMMSHEMRTPLNGVSGFAALLAERPNLDAEAMRQVSQIRHASDQLLMLVDEILDLSHGGVDLTPAPFSVTATVHDVIERVRECADAKGLRLTVINDLGRDAGRIGDARRIRQILLHLLGNAVKFTPAGSVTVNVSAEGGDICLRVTDTGPGIDEAGQAALFQPFHQGDASISRQHSGAGMGLAVCKQLVGLMSGEIGVESRSGHGASFHVRLPLPRVAEEAPAARESGAGDRAPRVLVVDDHPVNREVATLMLKAAGCEVMEACDGDEAVEAARHGGFDLILMDVRMPRMDGLTATRAIRALGGPAAAVPIVAMTADAMPEDVARCLGAGMDAHLAKPVNHVLLIETVGRSLKAAAAREAGVVAA